MQGVTHNVITNTEGLQHRLCHGPRRAESPVADIAGVINQEQQRNLILEQRADDGIIAIEKPAVLHNCRALLSHQVRAGTNADSLFFPAKRHVKEISILLNFAQQVRQVDIRQRRDEIDPRFLQCLNNRLRCVCRAQPRLTLGRFIR